MALDDTTIRKFYDYFTLADELSDSNARLDDFRLTTRRNAEDFAKSAGLSFPPRLAEAEEFYLSNQGDIDAFNFA